MTENKERKYSLIEKLLYPSVRVDFSKLIKALVDKTIVITGASYGIGKSLTLQLATTGAYLILVARTKDKLEALKAEVASRGGKAVVFAADLRNEKEIDSFIQFLLHQNKIDYFINNAGKSIRRPLLESLDRYHDFARTMAINYEAPVKLILSLLPTISKTKGHIINISSLSVLMAPAPYWAAYQASKTAFDQWFRCAMPEVQTMQVHNTSIYLPLVKTRMISPTKIYDRMPAMNPEHVARIICHCMLTKKQVYKPWWSFWGELASVLFTKTWRRVLSHKFTRV